MDILEPEIEKVLTEYQKKKLYQAYQAFIEQNRTQDAEITRYFHGCSCGRIECDCRG